MSGQWRKVVWDHLAEETFRELIIDPAEADDFIASAEFILSHDATMGVHVESALWQFLLAPVHGRTVYLFYTFNASTVTVVGVIAE
jgi:hypothetical protein